MATDPIQTAAEIERAKRRVVLTEKDGLWSASMRAHPDETCEHAVIANSRSFADAVIAVGMLAKAKGKVCRPVVDRVFVDGVVVDVH